MCGCPTRPGTRPETACVAIGVLPHVPETPRNTALYRTKHIVHTYHRYHPTVVPPTVLTHTHTYHPHTIHPSRPSSTIQLHLRPFSWQPRSTPFNPVRLYPPQTPPFPPSQLTADTSKYKGCSPPREMELLECAIAFGIEQNDNFLGLDCSGAHDGEAK